MDNHKYGILYCVPTERFAGEDPPPVVGDPKPGTIDMKFATVDPSDSLNFLIKHISDIEPELCDQHLDIGKTMGVRRVRIDSWESSVKGVHIANGGSIDPPGYPGPPPDIPPGSGHYPPGIGVTLHSDPATNTTIFNLETALTPPLNQTIVRRTREFTYKEFLLLNLNFKSPVAQTPAANVKWTFASKVAREAAGAVGFYKKKDIGKVALQDDEKSWWVLVKLDGLTPTWESQDLKSQIVLGLFTNRNVLFFTGSDGKGDGVVSPYFPYIDYGHYPDNHPSRNVKDQRELWSLDAGGYGFFIQQHDFGTSDLRPGLPYTFIPSYGNWLTQDHEKGRVKGDLGMYDSFAELDAETFDQHDIGNRAVVLTAGAGGILPFVYILGSLDPGIVPGSDPSTPSKYTWLPQFLSWRAAPEHFLTHNPYTWYQWLPGIIFTPMFGDVDYNYGSPYNPPLHWQLDVYSTEVQYVVVSVQFFNTDSDDDNVP